MGLRDTSTLFAKSVVCTVSTVVYAELHSVLLTVAECCCRLVTTSVLGSHLTAQQGQLTNCQRPL